MPGMSGLPKPKNVPVRPLSKGMVRDVPDEVLSDGAFREIKGYIATLEGLKSPPQYANAMPLESASGVYPGTPCGLITVWNTNGTQTTFLITSTTVYSVSKFGGLTAIHGEVTTGTVAASGTSVTGTSTTFADEQVQPGDRFLIDTEEVEIASIASNTALTLVTALSGAYLAGTSYTIRRILGYSNESVPDAISANNDLIVTSLNVPPLYYNSAGPSLDEYITSWPSTGVFRAECVAFFLDRLWFGHIVDETDGDKRQRIRWSDATDLGDVSVLTNYIDLPYTSGAVRRMVPLGDTLVVYFDDAIYIGTITNQPLLPLAFQRIDTGGIGLAAPRGVTAWLDGHFYLGQDTVYFLSNRGNERIGDHVNEMMIYEEPDLWKSQVCVDVLRKRVCFLMVGSERMWSFEYTAKAWSYESVGATDGLVTMIESPLVVSSTPMSSLTVAWTDASLAGLAWSDLAASAATRSLYKGIAYDNGDLALLKTTDLDYNSRAMTSGEQVIVSGSPDYGLTDDVKTWLRLSIRFYPWDDQDVAGAPEFQVWTSTNGGLTWVLAGTTVTPADRVESWVNFRVSSSVFSFKIVNSGESARLIKEFTLRVTQRGTETQTSGQAQV